MKKLTSVIVAALLVVVAVSCKQDPMDGKTTIAFTAKYNPTGKVQAGVTLDAFIINIEEVEIEYDEDDDTYGDDDVYDDIELAGPFTVNLLDNGASMTAVLANVNLPAGVYDEIEFEIDDVEDAQSPMYDKSIEVTGEIDGTPFIFYTDEEYEIEVEFENGTALTIDLAKDVILNVEFDLTQLFGTASGSIDLSQAKDGNGDGLIEIHYNDPDGNQGLADLIEDAIDDIIYSYDD